jgi:hypothetical protein
MTLGPLLQGRQILVHPDAMAASPHIAWTIVVTGGPLLAFAVALRQRAAFDRPTQLHHVVALALPIAAVAFFALTMPVERQPTVVGVVAAEDITADGWEYRLTTGETIAIDRERPGDIGRFGGQRVGALLLAGRDGGGAWHVLLPHVEAEGSGRTWSIECHELPSHGFDREASILFDIGLVLPKHKDFEAGTFPHNGRYEEDYRGRAPFCISPSGEVLGYLSISYVPCDLLDLRNAICDR